MTREEIIKNLKYIMEKHKNDNVPTFGTNISLMCKDILDYLEQEPFINKPCVSEKPCEHDKNVALDKIIAEVEEIETYDGIYIDRAYVLEIIDKYKAESER